MVSPVGVLAGRGYLLIARPKKQMNLYCCFLYFYYFCSIITNDDVALKNSIARCRALYNKQY